MACGRPKNLEIAGRNLLCRSRERRRNFSTTGNGNRRRGNPEPLAKGETPEPARQRAALGHGLRASGATRQRGILGPLAQRKTRSHPAKGNLGPLARGEPGATRQRGILGPASQEDPEPPAKRILSATRRGGNPGPPGTGRALRQRRQRSAHQIRRPLPGT